MKSSREFYEKEYHYDEDVAVIDERRIKHFFKEIKFDKVNRFLDIGCGVGWALRFCYNKGVKCIGFDVSEKAIHLSKKILNPEIGTLIADGEKLPFADESFDLVSAFGTIEHFSSPAKGLEQIKRITKKNGQMLLVVPNSYWILNKLMLYKGTEQPQEMLATLGQWVRFIQKHQFKVEKVSKDLGPKIFKNRKPIGVIKRVLLKFSLILPKLFAYQFIFICRKR